MSLCLFSSAASLASPTKVRSIPPPDPVSSLTADAPRVVNFYGAQAVAEYLSGLQAAQDEAAAEQARQDALRASQRVSTPAPVTSTVGECSGFVIPAYIIQRESGGNPSAYNPSGAYGCAQTLLGHYNPGGACAGLNPYDIQGQRDCVYRLSNGGTNLAPWATG